MVMEEIALRIEAIREGGSASIVIVDAALLVETDLARHFDRLVVVTCSEQRQLERLRATRGLDRDEALRRIRAQASSNRKAALAHYLIDNDGPIEQTRAQVELVFRGLSEDFERKKAADPWPGAPP